jgi:small-conductance mechanosensitive channel
MVMDFGLTKIGNDIIAYLPRIPEILMSLAIGTIIIYAVLALFTNGLKVIHVPRALAQILKSLCSIILWIILFADILRQLGLNQVAVTLSGSLLVIGLAIANGANTLVADILSGLFLAKDPDFDVGYTVKVGDVEGVIETIDFRKTRIRTPENKLIVMPNSLVDKDKWQIIDKPVRGSVISKLKNRIIRKRV